ncbi:MAG: hypothetical protein GWN00_02015 [Aliifodinibius sp.]|nr:hypothetical protein [Fodinibius sp.]NIV10054.1 hypothetical protein [Fodinibius sp.]NIY23633.1 hypothetical protein [Fodinibius sp.]
MIFLTVGIQFTFYRLYQAVDDAFDECSVGDEIIAQVGESSYIPCNFKSFVLLEKKVFD